MTMQPGRELNKLVAEAMGQTDFNHPSFEWCEETFEDGDGYDGFFCPRCGAAQGDTGPCVKNYSMDWRVAGQAWEWLEKNHPWKWDVLSSVRAMIRLQRCDDKPSVMVECTEDDYNWYAFDKAQGKVNFYFPGESYPHAIALAVVGAHRMKAKQ
jgi:hypothetical protein